MVGILNMKIVYVILKDEKYQEVSREEYEDFEGEKYILPSFWRLMLVVELLLPYRYM